MNLKIICWNVGGLNDAGKRFRVSNLLKNWKPEVVCLQETKMEKISAGIVRICGVDLS
jgi:exonuclease III